FSTACKKQNIRLIGGDTTGSARHLFISVTVIGKAETKYLKFRSGAKAGDVVAVAGALGEAHAGLGALEKKIAGLEKVKARSLRPVARTGEGIWLARQKGVTAMMDISDGLYTDLGKLAEASKKGAMIDFDRLKPSKNLVEAAQKLKVDPLPCM